MRSLIAELLCETACAQGRGVKTGKEENRIHAQVGSYSVCNCEAHFNTQTQKYPGPRDTEKGSGVLHMAKFPASSMGSVVPLRTFDISAIASSDLPHHKTLLPA